MFSEKKPGENSECRYCKNVTVDGGVYTCRYKGKVSPSEVCRRYRFDPFAKRQHRQRNIDTSMFDPLDFEI